MARALPIVLALGLLVPLSCGGGDDDREQVEQTVRDFITATNERDSGRFCDELVAQAYLERSTGAKGERARDECKRQLKAVKGLRLELVRIRDTRIDGDAATVTALIKTQGRSADQTLRLKREDGDWKLSASAR